MNNDNEKKSGFGKRFPVSGMPGNSTIGNSFPFSIGRITESTMNNAPTIPLAQYIPSPGGGVGGIVEVEPLNEEVELKPAVILGPDDESPNSGPEIIRRRPAVKKTENTAYHPLDDFFEERYDTKKEAYLAGFIAGTNMNSQNGFKRRY